MYFLFSISIFEQPFSWKQFFLHIHRHLSEKYLFCLSVTRGILYFNIVVVVTSCSYIQSIYHFPYPLLPEIVRKRIEYTHTDTNTRPELHTCTNIQIQVFLADTLRFISFISLSLQEHIHPSNYSHTQSNLYPLVDCEIWINKKNHTLFYLYRQKRIQSNSFNH